MVNTVAAANAGNRHGELSFVRAIRRGNIEMASGFLGRIHCSGGTAFHTSHQGKVVKWYK